MTEAEALAFALGLLAGQRAVYEARGMPEYGGIMTVAIVALTRRTRELGIDLDAIVRAGR